MASNAIEQIRDRLDIVDLVSGRVALKRSGRNLKGLCPFHQEKTPSFVVFPDSQNFHCFGCGKGGDIFTYYQLVEKVEFRDALRELAQRASVELDTFQGAGSRSDPIIVQTTELNDQAAALYSTALRESSAGEVARKYLTGRGLSREVIDRFRLGFAPDSWDFLLRQFSARGVAPQAAANAGLLQPRDTGGFYDRFRNRIIFPIMDRDGSVAGFGGRALGDELPKYLNSAQSAAFDKGRLLYALDLAVAAIREQDESVIVEGYMDAIAAHQFGFTNVVAAMGTALTDAQIDLVRRLSRRVVLALDADSAGLMAAHRTIEDTQKRLADIENVVPIAPTTFPSDRPPLDPRSAFRFARRLDTEVMIAELPPGQDPDSLIRAAPNEWPEAIRSARPYAAFIIDKVLHDIDLDSASEKRAAVGRLAPILQMMSDQVMSSHYVDTIARRLGLNYAAVQSQVQGAAQRAKVPAVTGTAERDSRKVELSVEDQLLALLLRHRSITFDLLTEVPTDELVIAENRELLTYLRDPTIADSQNGPELLSNIDRVLAEHGRTLIDSLNDRPSQTPGEVREEILQLLVRLERDRYEILSAHLRNEIAAAESTKDQDSIDLLFGQLDRLAVLHRRLYPRPSPYFPDSRTKQPVKKSSYSR
jgi:DNA primase